MGTKLKSMMQDAELDGFCAGQENERKKIVAKIEETTNELHEDNNDTQESFDKGEIHLHIYQRKVRDNAIRILILAELKSWITTRPKENIQANMAITDERTGREAVCNYCMETIYDNEEYDIVRLHLSKEIHRYSHVQCEEEANEPLARIEREADAIIKGYYFFHNQTNKPK